MENVADMLGFKSKIIIIIIKIIIIGIKVL